MKIAREIVIDNTTHRVSIDGVNFPFWLSEEPMVTAASEELPLNAVTLVVLTENLRIVREIGTQRFDTTGDTRDWCQAVVNAQVNETLGDTLAWLRANGHDL